MEHQQYSIGRNLLTPSKDCYILIKNYKGKTLIRPDIYTNFYTTRGWRVEALGTKALMESIT